MKKPGATPAVVLCNPKYPHNVAGVLRTCSCFGVSQLWWTGSRVSLDVPKHERLPREERMRGYADVKLFPGEAKPLDAFADCTPVAIELVPGAQLLPHFEHPQNAVYVFGPEDGSVPAGIRRLCHSFIAIPTAHCLNLSQAVTLVLYDRLLKDMQAGRVEGWSMGDFLTEHRGYFDPSDDTGPRLESASGATAADLQRMNAR